MRPTQLHGIWVPLLANYEMKHIIFDSLFAHKKKSSTNYSKMCKFLGYTAPLPSESFTDMALKTDMRSTSSDDSSAVTPTIRMRKARGPSTSFPMKLHQMIDNAEAGGYQHVISWLPGGREFQIHDTEGMVNVLRLHFNQTKYKSFLRQLQNYGFHRHTRGPRKGICSHKLFVQWDPVCCLQMKRGADKANNCTNHSGLNNQLRVQMSSTPITYQDQGLSTTKTEAVGVLNTPTSQLDIIGDNDDENIATLLSTRSSNSGMGSFTTAASPNMSPADTFSSRVDAEIEPNTDCWLTKLLNREDLWGDLNNIPLATTSRISSADPLNLFEPNHIQFTS